MRRVRYSVAVSLDGYIAGPKGEYDRIVMDPDIDFGALFKEFHTVLMGRKSYEAARNQGGGEAMPGMQAHAVEIAIIPGLLGTGVPKQPSPAKLAKPRVT